MDITIKSKEQLISNLESLLTADFISNSPHKGVSKEDRKSIKEDARETAERLIEENDGFPMKISLSDIR